MNEKREQGDAGDAIDYACDHVQPGESHTFLEDWRSGRADQWPDYMRWLRIQRASAAAAKAEKALAQLRALISEESIEKMASDIAGAVLNPTEEIQSTRLSAMIRLGRRLREPLESDLARADRIVRESNDDD